MGPRAGLDGCAENVTHIGIRSPDRPVRCESLYLLSYPGPPLINGACLKCSRIGGLTCVIDIVEYGRGFSGLFQDAVPNFPSGAEENLEYFLLTVLWKWNLT